MESRKNSVGLHIGMHCLLKVLHVSWQLQVDVYVYVGTNAITSYNQSKRKRQNYVLLPLFGCTAYFPRRRYRYL